MRVNFNKQYNIPFKSTRRCIYADGLNSSKKNTAGNVSPFGADIVYSNRTSFFRDDLYAERDDWSCLAANIISNFYYAPKVNVYNFACSDGSETFSLAISLIEALGAKKAEKFFPIKACDIDNEVINTAKNGAIPCDRKDIARIERNTAGKLGAYFTLFPNKEISRLNFPFILNAKENLKKTAEFSQRDFFDEIDKIKKTDSLVLCRNFLPYLKNTTAADFAKKLAENLDESSMLIIGDFDRLNTPIVEELQKNDFFEHDRNTFIKF